MYLQKITLFNFKNFESETFEFESKINCFVGNNGVGKTNVLDAIYYLSFAKSYFNPIASQNIRHHQDFFMIEGDYFIDGESDKIICSLKKGQKKILKKNGKIYEKFSDHIGSVPLVIISPADRDLIVEGSESRRKFLDGVISQLDKPYLQTLISYNKVLSQRNALLKYFAANRTFDALNLEIYNEQLCDLGKIIHEKRTKFIKEFIPIFQKWHAVISENKETVSLVYKSKLNEESLDILLEKSLEKDRVLQYTSVGIQRDDLSFEIDGFPIKKFGSQGQQKTYLIALKLAQYDFIKKQSNRLPILLLDDVFDKLDATRVQQIVNLVNDEQFGQIFISDTHFERTEKVVKETKQPYKIIKL
ncbi:DNA replication/repair protein RecF [Aureivirga marina]|uniref:DNA replication/repair protein RecF n=1 Tax=Aureivirga marina TaxID=1182451 RepID=UPI0018C9A49B|nr:DNA replication and repair protein RecF [Aureivirga marina]